MCQIAWDTISAEREANQNSGTECKQSELHDSKADEKNVHE